MTDLNYTLLGDPTDLDALLDRIGKSQFVLLGESSHGTSEFYKWRIEISKRLIKEKEFSFVGVEGDWPDCCEVNKYVKGLSDTGQTPYKVLHSFNRWPTWMWANKETADFVAWLKSHNDSVDTHKQNKVGFYGLDLYSLWESVEAIIKYLKRVDPSSLKNAIDAFNCFEPYDKDVEKYARATAFVPTNCEDEVIETLTSLRSKHDVYSKGQQNKEEYFNAEQNAITAKDAERYYRTMMKGDVNSWNLRDTHMMDTLERLINFHRQVNISTLAPKAIVWAHNTHIGDARFTNMRKRGMTNIGQLVREKKGSQNAVLIGFSTYSGTVIASREWGKKMERMDVPPAKDGSWDNLLHNLDKKKGDEGGNKDKLLIFPHPSNIEDKSFQKNNYMHKDDDDDDGEENDGANGDKLMGQRAIGVVYNPEYERYGNYVPTDICKRYDALLFIDKTNALSPLHMQETKDNKEPPETFPTGQ
jgi:erythromycin esterase-like protein